MAKTDGSGAKDLITKGKEQPKTLAQYIEQMKPEMARALPKHMDADRMARIALTTIRTNPKLSQCEGKSFLAALMTSSQLGLEPNTPLGEAYIIPYGKEASFQIGYKGLLSLAYRTGEYKTIYAHEVYPNDTFDYGYGLEPHLKHVPADEPEGEPIYYYGVYHLQNGGRDFRVWSRKKIENHAKKYSQAFKKGWSSPWKTDFDSMAKKTVLIDLLKYAPKSIEFSRQLTVDNTVKREISEDMTEVEGEYIEYAEYEDITDSPQEEGVKVEPQEEEPKEEPAPAPEKKEDKKQDKKQDTGQQTIDADAEFFDENDPDFAK